LKILSITVGDKSHRAGRISSYLSRKAIELQKNTLKLARLAKDTKLGESAEQNVAVAEGLLDALTEIRDQKAWLICQVYGGEFTVDELEQNLTDAEIEQEVAKIIGSVTGIVTKN